MLEFIYLYLLPERSTDNYGSYSTDTARRIPSTESSYRSDRSAGEASIVELDERYLLRTGKEKQGLLSRYYGNLGELMDELETTPVFEEIVG